MMVSSPAFCLYLRVAKNGTTKKAFAVSPIPPLAASEYMQRDRVGESHLSDCSIIQITSATVSPFTETLPFHVHRRVMAAFASRCPQPSRYLEHCQSGLFFSSMTASHSSPPRTGRKQTNKSAKRLSARAKATQDHSDY